MYFSTSLKNVEVIEGVYCPGGSSCVWWNLKMNITSLVVQDFLLLSDRRVVKGEIFTTLRRLPTVRLLWLYALDADVQAFQWHE